MLRFLGEIALSFVRLLTGRVKFRQSDLWIEVEEVRSSQLFEVEMEDGSRFFGSLAVSADGQAMVLISWLTPPWRRRSAPQRLGRCR